MALPDQEVTSPGVEFAPVDLTVEVRFDCGETGARAVAAARTDDDVEPGAGDDLGEALTHDP